ncbi:PCNA-associated factor isoform X1 [Ovis aries]|uniref:PCNA-associated factor isoform X1 n=1 Tax=Ovis aries TaxID=9940 RepID=UPI0029526645|nr:PCNA-associated factor isoform X1 [Ovis aries]
MVRTKADSVPGRYRKVVASRAPRKVLGSSTSANSTPLSSRKGKNALASSYMNPLKRRSGQAPLIPIPTAEFLFLRSSPPPEFLSSLPFDVMSEPWSLWRVEMERSHGLQKFQALG